MLLFFSPTPPRQCDLSIPPRTTTLSSASVKFALVGGNEDPDADQLASRSDAMGEIEEEDPNSKTLRGASWGGDRDRLLDLLFAWKAGEAWREVLLLCGAEVGPGRRGGLGSACEFEVRKVHGVGLETIVMGCFERLLCSFFVEHWCSAALELLRSAIK